MGLRTDPSGILLTVCDTEEGQVRPILDLVKESRRFLEVEPDEEGWSVWCRRPDGTRMPLHGPSYPSLDRLKQAVLSDIGDVELSILVKPTSSSK